MLSAKKLMNYYIFQYDCWNVKMPDDYNLVFHKINVYIIM